MSDPIQSPAPAWEPLTPRGVAAFARATPTRLWLVQSLVALLAGASVIWFLHRAWFPVVRGAIHELPASGEISRQKLDWPGDTPTQLAANHFLGIAVDLNHGGLLGREAHLQIEFGRRDLRLYSLLGYVVLQYPAGWRMAFNQTELDPWWGAWEPAILAAAGFGTAGGLLLLWMILATLYFLPLRIIVFIENRDLNLAQCWRLAGAALLPGALFMTCAIFAYTLGIIDLIRLGGLMALHMAVGWVYLVISPLFLPAKSAANIAKPNPFVGDSPTPQEKTTNPFAAPTASANDSARKEPDQAKPEAKPPS